MSLLKKVVVFAVTLSLCMFCACSGNNENELQAPQAANEFGFDILKVGQADAIIMQTKNNCVVIDLGEKDDGDKIVQHMQAQNIKNIDYLFITHFDKDHVGGFPEVIENIGVKNIYVPSYQGTSDEYFAYLEAKEKFNPSLTELKEDTSFVIDDVLFEISTPQKQAYAEGDNDFSLVISATHGKNSFLFAGDAETERIPEVLSKFGRPFDFFKVPHHGKHNKNTKRLINTIKPQYAVICDSEKNPASDKVVSLLQTVKSNIYSTANGNVSVYSNGHKIEILQSK